ncbi:MAG: hypothetical protein EXR77_06310 [Myxococcales bacterium]|nr:hypothetical protein [Myxococcales bacterium]
MRNNRKSQQNFHGHWCSAWSLSGARRFWTIAALTAFVGAVPLDAIAQGKDKPTAGGKKKSKEYSFEDDVIETQYLRPDTANVEGLNKKGRDSLIQIRRNFFAELIRSAEDL